ncbi:MAG: CDP-glucose 4,6-dehydratase, partial [Muribaculaceae bacterium]|nr:CDP-glucose 4,6-dehydratase [Muribaculaceae bacterium]
YKGKRLLVTGNTGFKGSWLTAWLLREGAEVYGYASGVPTEPSMFRALGLDARICHTDGDVRDYEALSGVIDRVRPDFIFHLAAQAIVSTSYYDPAATFSTNVIGMVNLLEALRHVTHPCVCVLVTSDKVYDNVEWPWGYREIDRLGGKDPYSGSKGAAELVARSYWYSFLKHNPNVTMAIGRAGNVIGGGDWAADRLVPDCMRAFARGAKVELRCPQATRPWQHVLEPLSGYLTLGKALADRQSGVEGEAFNFGPAATEPHTVLEVVTDMARLRGLTVNDAVSVTDNMPFDEASILKLNCDKAAAQLRWHSQLDYKRTLDMVVRWYAAYYDGYDSDALYNLTMEQIDEYAGNGRC